MIEVLLILWVICALCMLWEQKNSRIIIYFGVFSLFTAVCFLLMGSPDVAMAEAAISAFTAIFFIVGLEKCYKSNDKNKAELTTKKPAFKVSSIFKWATPLVFVGFLLGLFLYFTPDISANPYLKQLYVTMFQVDVGGENAVTAIYLGYRVFDTLFEALLLVTAVVGVKHMSWYSELGAKEGRQSEIENYKMAIFSIRIVCPLIIMFTFYLIVNGHVTTGGGFHGGLALATFFICRYMIYNIYDISISKVLKIEELVFTITVLLAVVAIFSGALYHVSHPIFQDIYLTMMNTLLGMKVACAFLIIFYRYIAIERR